MHKGLTFAKLFDTEFGQVLVTKDTDEENERPVIKQTMHPPGLGLCSIGLGFEDSELGETKRDAAFELYDQVEAERVAKAMLAHCMEYAG